MKLIVDARYTRTTQHDGISRYTASLIEALQRLQHTNDDAVPANFELLMAISDDAQLKMLPNVPHIKICSPTGPLEPLASLQLNKYSPDVVFSPMQTMGTLGRKFKVVLTLHDLIYYEYPTPPSFLPRAVQIGWRIFHKSYLPQRFLLNRADAVATVSRTTAELIKQHRLTRRPLHVIANAPQPGSVISEQEALTVATHRTKGLLYMGSFMPYKGVETLIQAMKDLPDYRLHLLSRINPADHARLKQQAPSNVIFHNGVEEHHYTELLSQATALLTATRAEGYGLPVVEAQASGCPVVISDIPIFKEIAPHALFASPRNPHEFAQAVRDLEDPVLQNKQIIEGLHDANQYSWDASARKLLEVLKNL